MADYTSQVAALEAALSKGTLTVESDGRRVTYRSIGELLSALDYFKAAQAAGAPGGPSYGATLATFGEG